MHNTKILLRFFDKTFIIKLLLLTLLYSLLPLAEIILLLSIGAGIGNYLTLAIAATTGFIGCFIAFNEALSILSAIRKKVKAGQYPGKEFINMAGVFVGAILLLTPGFLTDFFGFLLFFPFFRNIVGKIITKKVENQLHELYEYLKLYEL